MRAERRGYSCQSQFSMRKQRIATAIVEPTGQARSGAYVGITGYFPSHPISLRVLSSTTVFLTT